METFDREKHWENIYQTKSLTDVSWYQPIPETSLHFFESYNISKNASIIDIGGGDSFLVDHLIAAGYLNITVLDISASAIERVKVRLGEKATGIKWIVADIMNFDAAEKYDFWHDRAAFHFLTSEEEIELYVQKATDHIAPLGKLVVGTFSTDGPKKCSGIDIKQYSEDSLIQSFQTNFNKLSCLEVDHKTPFDTTQNFVFCIFEKK